MTVLIVTFMLLFPTISGTNLNGEDFELPQDFEGNANFVMMAFKRWQQEEVDTWIPLAKELQKEFVGFQYYELPTLSNWYRPLRGMIDGGMRGGIPDPNTRAITITVYTNKTRVMKSLKIESDDTIQLFLLNRDGKIVWRGSGPYDVDKEKEFLHALTPLFRMKSH